MDFLKGEELDINSNDKFGRFSEVWELNRHAVDATRAESIYEDGELMLEESASDKQRKNMSVHSAVERLNEHPSIFINYLRAWQRVRALNSKSEKSPRGESTYTER